MEMYSSLSQGNKTYHFANNCLDSVLAKAHWTGEQANGRIMLGVTAAEAQSRSISVQKGHIVFGPEYGV